MREIEVRVVSLEEADHGTAEFWLGGQPFGFSRLEDGELDEGETLMRPGDSVVHRGITHAWSNRSDRPATVVSVMISATGT